MRSAGVLAAAFLRRTHTTLRGTRRTVGTRLGRRGTNRPRTAGCRVTIRRSATIILVIRAVLRTIVLQTGTTARTTARGITAAYIAAAALRRATPGIGRAARLVTFVFVTIYVLRFTVPKVARCTTRRRTACITATDCIPVALGGTTRFRGRRTRVITIVIVTTGLIIFTVICFGTVLVQVIGARLIARRRPVRVPAVRTRTRGRFHLARFVALIPNRTTHIVIIRAVARRRVGAFFTTRRVAGCIVSADLATRTFRRATRHAGRIGFGITTRQRSTTILFGRAVARANISVLCTAGRRATVFIRRTANHTTIVLRRGTRHTGGRRRLFVTLACCTIQVIVFRAVLRSMVNALRTSRRIP